MMQAVLIYAFAAAVLGVSTRPWEQSSVGSSACSSACSATCSQPTRLRLVQRGTAADGAPRHPRRPARQALGAVRTTGGEARMTTARLRLAVAGQTMSSGDGDMLGNLPVSRRPFPWSASRTSRATSCTAPPSWAGGASATPRQTCTRDRVRRVRGVHRVRGRPAGVHRARKARYAYVGIYLIALLGLQHPDRLHGADLARARRLHGDRRVHVRAPHRGQRAVRRVARRRHEGHLDDPARGAVLGLAGLAFGLQPAALRPLLSALATFAVAVAMPSTVRRFEEFTSGSSGIVSSACAR